MPDHKTTVVTPEGLDALDRYFGIIDSFYAGGCDHGFKPAKTCPNAKCEARLAHVFWEALNIGHSPVGFKAAWDVWRESVRFDALPAEMRAVARLGFVAGWKAKVATMPVSPEPPTHCHARFATQRTMQNDPQTTGLLRAWQRFWNFRHHGVSFSKAFDRAFR